MPAEKYGKEHPEYYAQRGGRREPGHVVVTLANDGTELRVVVRDDGVEEGEAPAATWLAP